MTNEAFDNLLRSFLGKRPFEPFLVVLNEGDPIEVDDPEAVAFYDGAAGFIALDQVHFFESDRVKEFRPAAAQKSSP